MEYTERRSVSCPDLTIYSTRSPIPQRRRAFSEQFCEVSDADGGILGARAISRHSEPNLLRNNRERLLDGNHMMDNTGDLLVNVVKALTTYEEEDSPSEGGIDLFSDSEIKLDESESTWSIVNPPTESTSVIEPPKQLRTRAASEYGRGSFFRNVAKQQEESRDWTWSGNNPQIQEFMKIRAKQKEREQNIKSIKSPNGDAVGVDPEKARNDKGRRQSIFQRINNLIKRRQTVHQLSPPTPTSASEPKSKPMSPVQSPHLSMAKTSNKSTPMDKRKSIAMGGNVPRPHLMRQASNFSVLSSGSDQDHELLEKTTIADLIRAMEVVHMKEMLGEHSSQPADAPPPAVKRAAAAFAKGVNKRKVASPSRLSPLPKLDTSDEDSRRSSLNWERLRQARTRQRSITEPQNANTYSPFAKNKLTQEKRSMFTRRYSAFPAAINIGDSASTKYNHWLQLKKNISDIDRRFSVIQPSSSSSPQGPAKDDFVKLSHLLRNRSRDDRDTRLDRRSSSTQLPSSFTTPNRSVHITPITMRRTSMLPSSPLAGIPSTSSLASNVPSPLATETAWSKPVRLKSTEASSNNSKENDEDVKKKSRWRPLLTLVLKDKNKNKSSDDTAEPKPKD